MANREHWNVKDSTAAWPKLVGHPQEDEKETQEQAQLLFSVQRGLRCLEIGAGVGRLLKKASEHFILALGVDYSEDLVRISANYLKGYIRCCVVLNDGLHLPFAEGTFGFVYSFTCFQHMPDLETIQANLREAYRVLTPGGLFKMQTVCGKPDPSLYDGWVFPSPEHLWDELAAVGFRKESLYLKDFWIWVTGRK